MSGVRRRTRRRSTAGAVLVAALLATLTIPTTASAAVGPPAMAAEGASLPAVGHADDGGLVVDIVAASGDRYDPTTTTIDVPASGVVGAVLDSRGVSSGPIRLEWVDVDLPDAAAAEAAPSAAVRAAFATDVLLGSAEGAPSAVDLDPLTLRSVEWTFIGTGEFRVQVEVTPLDAAGAESGPSTSSSLVFRVAGAPDDEPDPGTGEPPTGPGTPTAPENPVDPDPPVDPGIPAGQSSEPAPASGAKRVIGAVHTDMVSAFLDGDALVLDSKADIDIDGNGVVDLGTRLASTETLFHLADASRTTIPSSPLFSFLGTPGSEVWLAPQTQDQAIIWPGFSTEHPSLSGKVRDAKLAITLQDVSGPGHVEVFLQGGTNGVTRTFSSTTALAPWTTGVPQHTHMNWAFSAPGTYMMTFQASGVVDGRAQTATNTYTMVVGDLAAHTATSATTLRVDRSAVASGTPLRFTATVAPTAAGAVQFRDRSSGVILGHTPVAVGAASFVTSALAAGNHDIVAEFVPRWSNEVSPSTSRPVTVTVEGDVREKPTVDDTAAPTTADLVARPGGVDVVVTNPEKRVNASGTLGLRVIETAEAGEWVSVWIVGSRTVWLGWIQADLTGRLTVDLPAGLSAGQHRVAVKDDDGSLIGWDAFSLIGTPSGGGGGGNAPGGGNTPPPHDGVAPVPAAPAQSCAPGIVLENGHIDAFFVSAANGQAVLQLMEDVTGHRVVREAESVLLRVRESAYRSSIPSGAPGTSSGYVLPLTQDAGLIWPGWDTNRTAASGYSDVTINITSVAGPGRVHLSTAGPFGDVRSLLTNGGYTLPGSIREPVPVHTHAQWVFSEKGIYTLTVDAVATDPRTGASLRTAPHRYVFQVGDAPIGDTFCGLKSSSARDAALVNAAVDEAAAAAIAADQAAAKGAEAAASDAKDATRSERVDTVAEATTDASRLGTAAPWALIVILVGGALVILAIAGGTLLYVRRLRRSELAFVPGGGT